MLLQALCRVDTGMRDPDRASCLDVQGSSERSDRLIELQGKSNRDDAGNETVNVSLTRSASLSLPPCVCVLAVLLQLKEARASKDPPATEHGWFRQSNPLAAGNSRSKVSVSGIDRRSCRI